MNLAYTTVLGMFVNVTDLLDTFTAGLDLCFHTVVHTIQNEYGLDQFKIYPCDDQQCDKHGASPVQP
jgi:hypothetical protein